MITVHPCDPKRRDVHVLHGMASGYCLPGRKSLPPEGYSCLQGIDEGEIGPGVSFDLHSHRNVEILTYVVDGSLDYRDDLGNRELLLGGEVQVVLTGNGLSHSEANASYSEQLHIIQASLTTDSTCCERRYQQQYFPDDFKLNRLYLIASGQPQRNALQLSVDVNVQAASMRSGEFLLCYRAAERRTWIQIARGKMKINDKILNAGDAIAIEGDTDTTLHIAARSDAEFLLFDLP